MVILLEDIRPKVMPSLGGVWGNARRRFTCCAFVLHVIMCLSILLKRKRKIGFYMSMWQSINLHLPPFWILRVMPPTETREEKEAGGDWRRKRDWLVTWAQTTPRRECCLLSLTRCQLLSHHQPSFLGFAMSRTRLYSGGESGGKVMWVLRTKCSTHLARNCHRPGIRRHVTLKLRRRNVKHPQRQANLGLCPKFLLTDGLL